MKALNKIYLHGYDFDEDPCKTWEREPKVKGMRGYPAIHVEYIRKDALMEWLQQRMSLAGSLKSEAYKSVIDKLNEL